MLVLHNNCTYQWHSVLVGKARGQVTLICCIHRIIAEVQQTRNWTEAKKLTHMLIHILQLRTTVYLVQQQLPMDTSPKSIHNNIINIHSFMISFSHLFIYVFIHAFPHSFICLFICFLLSSHPWPIFAIQDDVAT